MEIFNRNPEEYLRILRDRYPANLERFFIPQNEELWKIENYQEFLEVRRDLIANAINEFMENLLTDIDSESLDNIQDLLSMNESNQLEFKSSLRWNTKTHSEDKNLEFPVLKTINAFMNSDGGTLLIGVEDNKSIFGIEKDINRFGNEDKYELHLTNIISDRISKLAMNHIQISFTEVEGKKVCKINVNKSPRETFLKEKGEELFFIRQGNSTSKLPASMIKEYIDQHWK